VLLLVFYVAVIAADFVGPILMILSQMAHCCHLLKFTVTQLGSFVGPHIYPTTQGPTELETGDRKLIVDRQKPAWFRLFTSGSTYQLFRLSLPLPPSLKT